MTDLNFLQMTYRDNPFLNLKKLGETFKTTYVKMNNLLFLKNSCKLIIKSEI